MKKKIIIALTVSIICILISAVYLLYGKTDNVKTAKVIKGSISDVVEERATVFSKNSNRFYTDAAKTVSEVNFSVGDRVKKGDVILKYENDIALQIERANKQVEAISATYSEMSKGMDFRQISNAKLNISAIENNLEMAENNLSKVKKLYDNNALSKSEYDIAVNNAETIKNQLAQAKNNYDMMSKGVSVNVKKQYEAQIEEIMIQIKILEKSLANTSVTAEFDGIITELNAETGGMVQGGAMVVEIQDDKNICLAMELLAEDVSRIKEGMDVVISDENYKQQSKLTITRIYPKATSQISELGVQQKRVRVEADIKESEHKLIIGAETDISIIREKHDNVLLVDKESIYKLDGKEYVTVLSQGKGKEEKRQVTTGIKDMVYVEIKEGLKEGETVVLD